MSWYRDTNSAVRPRSYLAFKCHRHSQVLIRDQLHYMLVETLDSGYLWRS